jgi:hypothetical protein
VVRGVSLQRARWRPSRPLVCERRGAQTLRAGAAVAGRARPAPSDRELASVHEKLGGVLYILAEFDTAVSEFHRALELVRRLGDRKQEVATLLGLANVYNWGHKIDEVWQP